MKLNGEFIVRSVLDDIVAIPVGEAALRFNGMIMLNEVSHVIWQSLQTDTSLEDVVHAVTESFEVSREEAQADVIEFLDKLRKVQLLEE